MYTSLLYQLGGECQWGSAAAGLLLTVTSPMTGNARTKILGDPRNTGTSRIRRLFRPMMERPVR
ncbi:MAG: hypothetical protein WAV54_13655, partial [Acidimicrobiales bacterium]